MWKEIRACSYDSQLIPEVQSRRTFLEGFRMPSPYAIFVYYIFDYFCETNETKQRSHICWRVDKAQPAVDEFENVQ